MHEFELAADLVLEESLRKYPPKQVLHQAGFVYANTDSESTREVMERVIVRLVREGVKL